MSGKITDVYMEILEFLVHFKVNSAYDLILYWCTFQKTKHELGIPQIHTSMRSASLVH